MIITFSGRKTWILERYENFFGFSMDVRFFFFFPQTLGSHMCVRKERVCLQHPFQNHWLNIFYPLKWLFPFLPFLCPSFYLMLSSLSWLNSDRETPKSCIVLEIEGLSLSGAEIKRLWLYGQKQLRHYWPHKKIDLYITLLCNLMTPRVV